MLKEMQLCIFISITKEDQRACNYQGKQHTRDDPMIVTAKPSYLQSKLY
jgi:hypothetical protein